MDRRRWPLCAAASIAIRLAFGTRGARGGSGGSRGGPGMTKSSTQPRGLWRDGQIPANVRLGSDTLVTGAQAFHRFQSKAEIALTVGNHCTMDGVHFAI